MAQRIANVLIIAFVALEVAPPAAGASRRGLRQVSWPGEASPRPSGGAATTKPASATTTATAPGRAPSPLAPENAKAPAPSATDKATAAPVRQADDQKTSLSVYSDSTFLPGTTALRTTMTRSSGGAALASQVAQDAARDGDTTLTATAATAWQSGRLKSDRLKADLAAMDMQSALQTKGAAEASRVAKSNVGAWAAGNSAQTSASFRASMSNDATAAAIRSALDSPTDAFRATATGSEHASSVTWEATTAVWE